MTVSVDDVAEVDASAELDALVLRHASVALGHAALNFNGAPHRVHHAHELHQHTVAGGLHDLAAVFPDLWINERPPVRPELRECAVLIRAHKTAVTGHVRGQNCCQLAFGVLLINRPNFPCATPDAHRSGYHAEPFSDAHATEFGHARRGVR
jgi:hypothetical protein